MATTAAMAFSPTSTVSREFKPRVPWIDLGKGVAIILVVLGHVVRGLHDAGLMQNAEAFRELDNSIYLFHVPLFFFLAGYVFSEETQRWTPFIQRALRTIAWPYLVWEVVLISLKLSTRGEVNHPLGPERYLTLLYHPVGPLWFLFALGWFRLAARATAQGGRIMFFLLAAAALAAHFLFSVPSNGLDSVLEYMIYFAFGRLLAGWRPQRDVSPTLRWVALLIFLLIDAGCTAANIGYGTVWGRLAAFPLVVAFVAGISGMGWKPNFATDTLEFLGKYSMPIFCIHALLTGFSRIELAHHHVDGLGPQIAIGTLMGVLVPIGVSMALSAAGIAEWFGFRPMRISRAMRPR